MKTFFARFIVPVPCILIGSLAFAVSAAPPKTVPFQQSWLVADSLIGAGLTQSALDTVNRIYKQAKSTDNQVQAIKAIIYRMRLESYGEEDAYIKTLNKLNEEIKDSKFPATPLLHSMLAECYLHYYQNNRGRFYNRTQTTNFDIADIHTWDLHTILEKTASEYELSLKDPSNLKKIIHDAFDALISDGNLDWKLRPTLYDFLVNRAIDFYSMDDNELTKPAIEFTLNNVNYFASFDKFMQLSITTPDSSSLKFHALKLLQNVIAFHANNNDIEALIDSDLQRLSFVRQHAVMANKDSLYLTALIPLANLAPYCPASAEADYHIASLYRAWANSYSTSNNERYRWMNKEALALCNKTMETYPKSFGAALCKKLVSEITVKSMAFTSESVNLPGKPFKALVTYKNVNRVYWRQIKIGSGNYQAMFNQPNYDYDSIVIKLAKIKPVKEWNTAVPDPNDYQDHSVEIEMPALPLGQYALLCASDSSFSCTKQTVAFGSLQISRISYINRQISPTKYEFHILDRETGAPLKGVSVKAWQRAHDEKSSGYKKVSQGTFLSDKEGTVVVPISDNSRYDPNRTIDCFKNDDSLYSNQENYYYEKQAQITLPRTYFFTDRAMYRPGQTIYFKGIMLRTNGDKSEITAGQNTNVSFFNVNNQEVAQLALTSNKYGSIHGSFIAPVSSLNGRMRIRNDNGSIAFSVEDYKRPRFEVTMDPFKGENRLGDTIHATGQAKGYSGAPIDGAKTKYRVKRIAHIPYYLSWHPTNWSSQTDICSGNKVTNDTGGFSIDFTALPDPSIPQSGNLIFSYVISIDVTDINGETRSTSSTINVGYATLKLDVTVGKQIKQEAEISFPLTTVNLNGTFEPAQGTIVIHRLKSPEKILRNRLWARPDTTIISQTDYQSKFSEDVFNNENDIATWQKENKVFEGNFDTKTDKTIKLPGAIHWKPGCYVLEGRTRDKFGQEVTDINYFTLFSENEKALPYPQTDWFVPVKTTCEPGDKAVFLVGSAYSNVKMLYELDYKNEIVKKEWLSINNEQKRLEFPIEEKHRGNLSFNVAFVHCNRGYENSAIVNVPWTNKELDISFETFRNKLTPGEHEEWRMKIAGKNKDKIAAEMVATLYDASLDAFTPHNWDFSIYPLFGVGQAWNVQEVTQTKTAMFCEHDWNIYVLGLRRLYPSFNWFRYGFEGSTWDYATIYRENKLRSQPSELSRKKPELKSAQPSIPGARVDDIIGGLLDGKGEAGIGYGGGYGGGFGAPEESVLNKGNKEPPKPDLTQVAARANLNETAFFYPDLQTNEKGEIIVKFQIPEALTKWKMLGFAHTKDLCFGQITKELVTQKDLMVVPNPPRFFRENDKITFSAKVSNLSDSVLSGNAQLFLFDAASMKPVDSLFKNTTAQIPFTARKGQSTALLWDLSVPEGIGAVTCKVVAKSGSFSDGEEHIVPVLSNRMLVTESMPLHIRKNETKSFTFSNLLSQNNNSKTLKNHALTLEFTTNPVWYAVQALPYLMEYPYECAEQTFARFYANSIAAHIANSSPHIKAVFDQWKMQSPDALLSNLEKNQELKALMLEETPWLLDGKNESERKNRVALLFDLNKLANEKERSLAKLRKLQMSDGAWPWFEGGPDDRYITQYIATGLAKLEHLGMLEARHGQGEMTFRCIMYLDNRIREDYERILEHGHPADDNLSELHIQYLYMRSNFKDVSFADNNKAGFDYFIDQSKKYWLQKRRYMQGMIALALNRFDDIKTPASIMRSLKENSLTNEEMGMYWKEIYEGHSWWWYEAPIESQALMIEAFDEVAHDSAAVDDLKTWLIKSKQTQNWKTTRATAEACYALLLRGTNWLEKQSTVSLKLGDIAVDPANVKDTKAEAGTGYFKTSWSGADIKPAMGNISVNKQEPGVAWGAVYWQYFEQLDNIKFHETPLKIVKKLFLRQNAPSGGPRITPVTENTALKPGDKLTVRIELRVDRDMEYVHMKDMHASGFEPVNVFSGYRWQDALGYYESTRDAATNFFISYLRKGVYVFEYPLVVTHAGDFSDGTTTIQSMYAPEFTSHSEGVRVKVGK